MVCRTCRVELVSIEMVHGQSEFRMQSCPSCDTSEWRRNGEPIALEHVIAELNAGRTRYRRSPVR